VIALDTNILVYAHRKDSEFHARAAGVLQALSGGRAAWAIPWPCVHEFLAIVTHPRLYAPPSTTAQAIDQVEAWLESPSLALLSESALYWSELRAALERSRAIGGAVHDARIAALCREHGVRELLTADRDFNRFAGLTIRNPLVS
jgi:hypothetical protein